MYKQILYKDKSAKMHCTYNREHCWVHWIKAFFWLEQTFSARISRNMYRQTNAKMRILCMGLDKKIERLLKWSLLKDFQVGCLFGWLCFWRPIISTRAIGHKLKGVHRRVFLRVPNSHLRIKIRGSKKTTGNIEQSGRQGLLCLNLVLSA